MRILAIDTALGACSACVAEAGGEAPLVREEIAMERGHAEALLPLLDRVVSALDGRFAALGKVAVTVGPGSFTGLRVGIAAARAVGLAARVPVVGVTTLSALLAPLVATRDRGLLVAAIDARHGSIYVQAVAPGGKSVVAPAHLPVREALRLLGAGPVVLTGSGASMLAVEAWNAGLEADVSDAQLAPDIAWVARLGLVADPADALPKPLYLRAPDARAQDHQRLARQ